MNIEYKQASTFRNLNSIWLNDWLNKYSFDDACTYLRVEWSVEPRREEEKRQKYAIHDGSEICSAIGFIPNTMAKWNQQK